MMGLQGFWSSYHHKLLFAIMLSGILIIKPPTQGGSNMATEKLYDLLMIKNANKDIKIKRLDDTIARTKAGMNKENIAWVEKTVEEMTDI